MIKNLILRIEDFTLPKDDYPYHSHGSSDTQLMIVAEGSAIQKVNDSEFHTQRGDVYVIGKNCAHGFRDGKGLRIYNVVFDAQALHSMAEEVRTLIGYQAMFLIEPAIGADTQGFQSCMRLDDGSLQLICNYVKTMMDELHSQQTGSYTVVNALFLLIVTYLSRHYDAYNATSCCQTHRLAKAVAYMESNYMHPIKKGDLAQLANLSERQFSRIFNEIFQMPPMEYLNCMRLDRSIQYLAETDWTITQIAMNCGFSDSSYFNRKFKKKTGYAPLTYRKIIRSIDW